MYRQLHFQARPRSAVTQDSLTIGGRTQNSAASRSRTGAILDAEKNTGIRLTESFAMRPGSSVSGFYFAHPAAEYFGLGRIDKDQVIDYAARKGMTLGEVERWLASNLNYEPSN